MEPDFSPEELRVLGCLIEKERTTPEQYPLSLNALRLACNQKTSRDPIVDYDEDEVTLALEALRDRGLVFYVRQSGARVTKYRHDATDKLNLQPDELTLLALLFLRGPQTVGELRSRSDRMYGFASIDAVEETLQRLINFEDGPLVRLQTRRTGQKEGRYEHTWAPAAEPSLVGEEPVEAVSAPKPQPTADDSELRAELEALQARVAELEAQFAEFRRQFE
ncbi:YceH family protein [Cerasicoccus fimbriatus]|uniref:YceH family protein n=1 Tax=Cerasicoccus fimbriatus TaxID=3014554 RepID=UPI0022B2C029|nr:YceH family protein [Cerasicoccus sp. TK19100]